MANNHGVLTRCCRIVSMTNCMTSMFAGIVIFSVIGPFFLSIIASNLNESNKRNICRSQALRRIRFTKPVWQSRTIGRCSCCSTPRSQTTPSLGRGRASLTGPTTRNLPSPCQTSPFAISRMSWTRCDGQP